MMSSALHHRKTRFRFDLASTQGSAVIPIVLALAFLILSMTVGLGYSHRRSTSAVRQLEEKIFTYHLRELVIQDVLSQLQRGSIPQTGLYHGKISDFNGYQVLPVELEPDGADSVSMTIQIRIPGKTDASNRKWHVDLKQTTLSWSISNIEEVY